MFTYFNGKFVPEEEAVVNVKTHALQYGTGIFEGIRAYYNEKENALFAFRMLDHYKRMELSGRILFMPLPHTPEELVTITSELLQKNFTETDIYIRPFLYKSEQTVSSFNLQTLENGFTIYTIPMGRYLDTAKGIKANISSWKRISDNAIPPRAKISGSYINTALAKTESQLNGYDEALLLDGNGHIVEGSAENLFLIKGNTLITPGLTDDILQGITRDTIMKLATRELKISITERSIDRTEIYQADEVFVVGTGAEVTPVIEVDKRKIGTGDIGMVTANLKDIYSKLVHGELNSYKEWITRIDK